MDDLYTREHVEAVLRRAGIPSERRALILDKIDFPLDLQTLQAALADYDISHDSLINDLGGSP